ncbi:uncharacterized protein LOC142357331 [Convolutriloba macropyga]|uniref:uncharacterized protein LOC142357331 n=1 Tax=Convolutriloba macropyga TaxID=536237 RepID=UPI003F51CDC6
MNAVRTALGTARSRNANGREGTSTVSPQTSRFMEAGSARRCGAQVRLVLSGTETGIAYRLSCPRASHSSAAEASNVPGSLGESLNSEIQLEESLPEKAMLILFAHKMAEQVQGVRVPLNPSFAEVVEVSREIYQGRSSAELQQLVATALDGILPPHADMMFKTVWPHAKWSAELDAQITKAGFRWLVGPMEIQKVEVEFEGKKQLWNSQVKIKRCRYLEAAGCVGMCTNLCKMPTQDFFLPQLRHAAHHGTQLR